MEQLDLFNIVDKDNVSFYIVYLDEEHVLKHSEQLNATKSTIYSVIRDWCEQHKNYRFMYYKSNKSIWED